MGYAHSQIRWSRTKLKKCHIDIYVKTKNELHMQWSTDWIQCSIYSKHSTHFYAASLAAVAYISKPELLCVKIVDDVSFSELKWNRSFRSKAAWAKSFLMQLDYHKKIIQSQHKTVRTAIATNMCGRKCSCELFPLATTHAKVANSGNSEVR